MNLSAREKKYLLMRVTISQICLYLLILTFDLVTHNFCDIAHGSVVFKSIMIISRAVVYNSDFLDKENRPVHLL